MVAQACSIFPFVFHCDQSEYCVKFSVFGLQILNIILDNKVSVAGKSYVEMAGVDNSIDHKLSDRIEMMGGRYLFMQVNSVFRRAI